MKPYLQWCYCLLFTLLSINAGAQEIVTIAGNGTKGYSPDGVLAKDALLDFPHVIAFDKNSNILLCEIQKNTVRKISSSDRRISTIIGTGTSGYTGDGGKAYLAKINHPYSVISNSIGEIFITDLLNRVIRKVDTLGNIYTIAGNGVNGCSGDGGLAVNANLRSPACMCFDKEGNLYFSDFGCSCVRKISTSGIISKVAGNGVNGFSGDGGPATNAQLRLPEFIVIDTNKNYLYIGDYPTRRVRKVDLNTGIITTFAGNGNVGNSGDGGLATDAELNAPSTVSLDLLGNVIIVDANADVIRLVDSFGIITTIAGTGERGYSPDGTIATLAKFNNPASSIVDKWGNIYFTDIRNYSIRRINYNTTSIKEQSTAYIKASIFPNPAHECVTVKTEGVAINELQLLDVTGCAVHSSVYKAQKGEIKLVIAHLPTGTYLLKVNGQYAGKVVKE